MSETAVVETLKKSLLTDRDLKFGDVLRAQTKKEYDLIGDHDVGLAFVNSPWICGPSVPALQTRDGKEKK